MATLYKNVGGPHRWLVAHPILRKGKWIEDVRVLPGDFIREEHVPKGFPHKWKIVPYAKTEVQETKSAPIVTETPPKETPVETSTPQVNPLHGLSWASTAAYDKAVEAQLTPEDFEGVEPTSAQGGFNTADVATAVKRKQG